MVVATVVTTVVVLAGPVVAHPVQATNLEVVIVVGVHLWKRFSRSAPIRSILLT